MQQQQFAFICTKFPENFNRNLFAGNKKGVRQQPNSFIFSNLYFYLLRLISIPPDAYSNRAELHPEFCFATAKVRIYGDCANFLPSFFMLIVMFLVFVLLIYCISVF